MMKKFKAFTLIEILVVLVIIGLLSGFIVVSLNSALASSRDAKKRADINSFSTDLEVYKSQHGGRYPEESSCAIGSCPTLDPIISSRGFTSLDENYVYESDGSEFTIKTTLSNTKEYSYNPSSGFSESAPGQAGAERITNGGFEGGDTTGWTASGQHGVQNGGHSGSKEGWIYGSTLSQDVDLTGVGAITFWVYYNDGSGETFKIDGVTKVSFTSQWDWTKFTVDTSSYSGIHNISFDGSGYGELYFDDISAMVGPVSVFTEEEFMCSPYCQRSWQVPPGVTSINVIAIGGGGGGHGGGNRDYGHSLYGGAGGNSSTVVTRNAVSVTPGQLLYITTGPGGAGGSGGLATSGNGSAGTQTSVAGDGGFVSIFSDGGAIQSGYSSLILDGGNGANGYSTGTFATSGGNAPDSYSTHNGGSGGLGRGAGGGGGATTQEQGYPGGAGGAGASGYVKISNNN